MTDPATVIRRLWEIDAELALRQGSWADAASKYAFAKRDYERRHAEEYAKASRELKVDERKADVLLALVKDGTYKALVVAEADLDAHKAVFNVLDRRASIGQSILRALTQEANRSSSEPAWSPAA